MNDAAALVLWGARRAAQARLGAGAHARVGLCAPPGWHQMRVEVRRFPMRRPSDGGAAWATFCQHWDNLREAWTSIHSCRRGSRALAPQSGRGQARWALRKCPQMAPPGAHAPVAPPPTGAPLPPGSPSPGRGRLPPPYPPPPCAGCTQAGGMGSSVCAGASDLHLKLSGAAVVSI